ncbi:hypothetical protein Scep_029568 [Stephania cephalantha]|uniref:RRM domain-containing protein n=1 Tax=Stephania cephalantha TaxID=152367 RepID=A0AAP0HFR0_9MAGN
MSNIIRKKEKYKGSAELPRDDVNGGTAARTRPFSFQEIMLRRKNKKLHADADGDPHNKETGESVSNSAERDGVYGGKNSLIVVTKHTSGGNVDRHSKKKEEITTSKQASSLKGKGKETNDVEADLNNVLDKGRSATAKEESKIEKQSHGRGRNKEHLVSGKENGYKMKRSDDANGKEKYRDIERENSAIESKRKHQIRDRDAKKHRLEKDEGPLKRHNSGKSYISEPAEKKSRKKVLSPPRYEEARPKKRRSRSLETRDRDNRSVSFSPRSLKHPYHGRDQGNSSHHFSKEKRQHSEDKKRMSKNGGYADSHHRNHSDHESKLGGYSPRKRRTEAAARTPSPTIRSPEKRTVGWDQPPVGTGVISSVSMISIFQSSNQTSSSAGHEFSGPAFFSPNVSKSSGVLPHVPLIRKDVSIDSIQLTQATRPMRRLYVESLPVSASEKALMECLNNFLLSSGANHIHGTEPCISCIVNKEKGQAVVEFLTPEDATAALSFDGKAFSGSNLKVRRPKDYVETADIGIALCLIASVLSLVHPRFSEIAIFMQTGGPEKSAVPVEASNYAISNLVKDTPYKVFIGGISKLLSSDMHLPLEGLGPLLHRPLEHFGCWEGAWQLAEHLLVNQFRKTSPHELTCKSVGVYSSEASDFPGYKYELVGVRCLYMDSSNANKACAGLNGMKLGGQVLTVMLAAPGASFEFNEMDLSSLSTAEFEETLEDVRLECVRFGTVKSINVVRNECSLAAAPQLYEVANECNFSALQDQESESVERSKTTEEGTYRAEVEVPNNSENGRDLSENVNGSVEYGAGNDEPGNELVKVGMDNNNDKPDHELAKDETSVDNDKPDHELVRVGTNELCQQDSGLAPEVPTEERDAVVNLDESSKHDATKDQINDTIEACQSENSDMESDLMVEEEREPVGDGSLQGGSLHPNGIVENEPNVIDECLVQATNDDNVFEHGCILVEYTRSEAACIAAHCLHGRLYGDKTVEVCYVAHDVYLNRFPR